MTSSPLTLFVAWRSPETRTIHPIARVVHRPDSGGYEFVYIRAAETAVKQGFRPLLEFPDLGKVYRSDRPFPLLANRLTPPSRPGYKEHLAALGLDPSADPMLILARTGGTRQTDQLELFPLPAPDGDGCYLTHCLVRAVQYMPKPGVEERIVKLVPGEQLFVMWDVQNPVDPHAIALRTEDYFVVGFLPAYLTGDAWKLQAGCGTLTVHVARVNPPPAEVHHRLLVRVAACWPTGFRPFSDPVFQPISAAGSHTNAV